MGRGRGEGGQPLGSLLHAAQLQAMARQGALVAFAVGPTAHVLLTHSPRARFAYRPCRAEEERASQADAGAADIVALAFGPSPQRALWAATARGDVLLFRLEHRQAPPLPSRTPAPPQGDAEGVLRASAAADDAVGPSQVFTASDLDTHAGAGRGRIQLLSIRGIVLAAAQSGGGGGFGSGSLIVHAFSTNATGAFKLYSHALPGADEGGAAGSGTLLAAYSAPAAPGSDSARGRRRSLASAPADGALLALANASAVTVFDCFAPAAAPAFGAPGGGAGGDEDDSFLGLVLAWLRSPLVLMAIAGLSFYCARGRGAAGAGDGDDDGDGEQPRRGWQRSLITACAALFGRTPMGAMMRSQLAARDYSDADNAAQLRRSLGLSEYANEHLRGVSSMRSRSRVAPRGGPSLAQQLLELRRRQLEGEEEEEARDAGEHAAASNAVAAFAGGGASDGGQDSD